MTRIAVNGLGRIGRAFLRAALSAEEPLSVVAINDLAGAEQLAYLLRFDSVSSGLKMPVTWGEDFLKIGDSAVMLLRQPEPGSLPWAELGIDVVIETTRPKRAVDAGGHRAAGARVVVLPRESPSTDATFIVGFNDHEFDPDVHRIVSCGSCTMNCIAVLTGVLDQAFGVRQAMATTVHAYTSEQPLVDSPHLQMRQGRAAAVNIVPVPDRSIPGLADILPGFAGRLGGGTVRVPVTNGCLVELTAVVSGDPLAEAVNEAFWRATTDRRLGRILRYSEDPLVSSDIGGRAASCTFDAPLTQTVGNLVRVHGWFDNEWAYACRLVDLTTTIGAALAK